MSIIQFDNYFKLACSIPSVNTIRFDLSGSLTGWAGIGFSKVGKAHNQMDTYAGWISSTGNVVLQDGYSNQMDIPSSDSVQSVKIISGSQIGDTFRLIFERSLNTQDAWDFVLRENQAVSIFWAYHLELKPSSESISSYYPQHTHRGRKQFIIPTLGIKPTSTPVSTPSPSKIVPTLAPVLVPTLAPVIPTSTPVPSPLIPYLQGDENFYVYWNFTNDFVYFTYDCRVAGWVGIGFEPLGKIHQSTDMYISWILSSGKGYLQNGYSSDRTQIQVYDTQNIQVLQASFINKSFQLSFKRPIHTNNSLQFQFQQSNILMGWAYHSIQYPNTTNIYRAFIPVHTNRGSVIKNIYTGETLHSFSILPSTYYILASLVLYIGMFIANRWFVIKNYFTDNIPVCVGLIVSNGITLWMSILSGYSQSDSWGYLATANSLLIVLPSTRKLLFSLDQTLNYHQWLGRLILFESFIHFVLSPFQLEGSIAFILLLIITLTSITRVRRKMFNFFFYSHYLFFLYLIFGSLHSQTFLTHALIFLGIYLLDQIVRIFETYPRKIISIKRITNRMIELSFPKNRFKKKEYIGQYVFLNFPQLSLLEWHPFTLASCPSDPFHKVYIKNLGDYTRNLIFHATHSNSKKLWVRVEGPYGKIPFQIENYTHIILICGGVGITPCISFLKEVYKYGSKLEYIYLAYCCSKETEAEWINQELVNIIQPSEEGCPRFCFNIFITGQDKIRNLVYNSGRPSIDKIFDTIEKYTQHSGFKKCVYTCGPKQLVEDIQQTWKKQKLEKIYDYYQDILEF
jgi:predicted ferric reductase